jgi:8-oxo-dGTP pyrophosphatase MutT (NUDIX family)
MQVVYARTAFPVTAHCVIFLAGPTPRAADVASWRPEACAVLRELSFEGTVYVPEDAEGGMHGAYEEQIRWEAAALLRSDVVVFWVPRDMRTMPGLTTNDEFGWLKGRARIVFGAPEGAEKVRYQQHYCRELGIPVKQTLRETLAAAVAMVGEGARREGADVLVPAHVFVTPSFQRWKAQSLTRDGNELLDLRVRDLVCVGSQVFLWSVWVRVRIRGEDRVKENEIVVGRADLSSVAVWCRDAGDALDSKVVLVEEFRSAGGRVLELPGGSVLGGTLDALDVALEELREEIGLERARGDLVALGSRTMAPTLAPHANHAFALAVGPEVIARYEQLEREGACFGLAEDSERTFVRVLTIRDILASDVCCWTTVGIVASLLLK